METLLQPKPALSELPAKLFKLPYADEFYVCTCEAIVRSDCTCDQETVITTHYNSHLRNPDMVAWLAQQSAPFRSRDAAVALGLSEFMGRNETAVLLHVHSELKGCGCQFLNGLFTAPDAETLSGLRLRRPAHSQSQPVAQQPSPALPADHREPSPASHADHRSTPADQVDPLSPQRSA